MKTPFHPVQLVPCPGGLRFQTRLRVRFHQEWFRLGVFAALLGGGLYPASAQSQQIGGRRGLPIIPITVHWSSGEGWSVSGDGKIRTPIGTFAADASLPLQQNRQGRYLIFKDGVQQQVYLLDDGPVSFQLPASAVVSTDRSGNIEITLSRQSPAGSHVCHTPHFGGYEFSFGEGVYLHRALLLMNGCTGTLNVSFYSLQRQTYETVIQMIRMETAPGRIIFHGTNPVYAGTNLAHPTYHPDTIVFQRQPSGHWILYVTGGRATLPIVVTRYW
jgi:hypothetical protein